MGFVQPRSATTRCVHNVYSILDILPQLANVWLSLTPLSLLKKWYSRNVVHISLLFKTMITEYLISSFLYYTSSHAAALVFVHCQVNICQLNIYYSYGFAMIGINLHDSSIDSLVFITHQLVLKCTNITITVLEVVFSYYGY